jgi:hypothetical protein
MLVFARPGKLDLLPAMPKDAMLKGSLRGILARGQIRIDRLEWDRPAGAITLELTSGKEQTITLRLPNSPAIKSIKVVKGTATVKESAKGASARELTLPKGEAVTLDIRS